MKNLAMIACIDKNWGIGQAGKLLWRIPEDMRFFKQTTMGGVVVMGRKTFASIGNPLPGRTNVVLSHEPVEVDGIEWCSNPAELDEFLAHQEKPIFIIGGVTLYQMFLDRAERIYLTEVDGVKTADTFFPHFDQQQFTRKILQTGTSDDLQYQIVEYTRKV